MSTISGKVAAVTGAGSGIGRGLALELAARGARVAISDVNTEGLAETARLLEQQGTQVHQQTVNVAERDAVYAWAEAVAGHFGAAHQIYNNAGIAHSRSILESEDADYERVFGVNLWGVIHGTKAFLPHVIASGDGHVVNVSSVNGFMAQPNMSHYVATKFAVRGFTETLRLEMLQAGHRVGVTSVHPGGIKTNIADAALTSAKDLGLPVSDADERRRKAYNEKLLKMDPRQAAKIICDGVEKNRPRVLVGTDAKAIDALMRVIPGAYAKGVLAFDKRVNG